MTFFRLSILMFVCVSCSSVPKKMPLTGDCQQALTQTLKRDGFLSAVKGRASLAGVGYPITLTMALQKAGELRTEIKGPFGAAYALFLVTKKWAYFYHIKKSIVYRLPRKELDRGVERSVRLKRFAKQLPFQVSHALFIHALMTRGILEGVPAESISCLKDEARGAFVMSYIADGEQRVETLIDPVGFYPQKTMLSNKGAKPHLEVLYGSNVGEGLNSFPRSIQFKAKKAKKPFKIKWLNMELLSQLPKKVLDWRPPSTVQVVDF